MEFPFGHHHGHHGRRSDEEEEEKRPYPPPEFQPPSYQFEREREYGGHPEHHRHPPPQSQQHFQHRVDVGGFEEGRMSYGESGGYGRSQPPSYENFSDFPSDQRNYPHYPPSMEPGPVYSSVQHVAHESGAGFEPNPSSFDSDQVSHRRQGHISSFFHHHSKGGEGSEAGNKPTVRVYSKAEPNFSLSILNGTVVLAHSDPSDELQHWIKDEKYSTKVKDEEGFPSFALVNKSTGQAIKHSIGATHPVQLCYYDPSKFDESVLWTESKDTGDGFRALRMVNNIRLNFDAFHGDKNHGGIHHGTSLVLWEWLKGDNQKWKIVPYC